MPITYTPGKDGFYFESIKALYEQARDKKDRIETVYYEMNNIYIHFHDCCEFMYIVDGTAQLLQPDRITVVKPGQLIAVSGFVPHGYYTDYAMRWSALIPRRFADNPLLSGCTFKNTVVDDPGGHLLDALRLLHAVNTREGSFAQLDEATHTELLTKTAETFVLLVGAAAGLEKKSAASISVLDTLEYLNEHFREDIRIPELARRMLCNQTTLAIEFKRIFGMTMNEYINHLRALEAYRLLRSPRSMSIREVAEQAGFGSIQTFYRVYKAEFGTTPTEKL